MTTIDTVTTSVRTPRPSNVSPHLTIQWDAGKVGVSAPDVRQRLSDGDPRIEVSGGSDGVTINPYMMEEGEAEIVAQQLTRALTS